ncbi:hypothetical protein JVT61DRAFT_8813 [Boletus reticuloceps]|uniref:Uncharacterized protein n=1 Tax=Boletus reticuloceps TaxID=495285 RepID=A0A8I2YH13_9AGAM|nr:hypothetical protein JVT61DRAFT_8813 [Boletus reticuloceps]
MVVMDFIDGLDVHSQFGDSELPGEVVKQLKEALTALHEQNLVHSDLRWSNILVKKPSTSSPESKAIMDVDMPWHAYLMDFELAGEAKKDWYMPLLNRHIPCPPGVHPGGLMETVLAYFFSLRRRHLHDVDTALDTVPVTRSRSWLAAPPAANANINTDSDNSAASTNDPTATALSETSNAVPADSPVASTASGHPSPPNSFTTDNSLSDAADKFASDDSLSDIPGLLDTSSSSDSSLDFSPITTLRRATMVVGEYQQSSPTKPPTLTAGDVTPEQLRKGPGPTRRLGTSRPPNPAMVCYRCRPT